MIQAKDLRIGNWFLANNKPYKLRLDLYSDGFLRMPDPGSLSPIPLTPSILEKAGFKKDTEGYFMPSSSLSLYYNHRDNNGHYFAFWNSIRFGTIAIRYVHDLQNLYYSITKEELTINL